MHLYVNYLLHYNVDIKVKIDDDLSQVLVSLKLNDKLSVIREKLKKNTKVEMDDTLLFTKKKRDINSETKSYILIKISKEEEETRFLNDIIEKKSKTLYLTKSSKPDWEFFNNKHKLDFGRTIIHEEFKEAKKRAFIMKGCEMTGIREDKEDVIKTSSKKEWVMTTNLFSSVDARIDLAKLGISVGTTRNRCSNSEINSTYRVKEYSKESLKFRENLKPTDEFIKAIEDAIKSKDSREFKKIIEEFGQFIPTEVILGGCAYFEESNTLDKDSKSNTYKADAKAKVDLKIDITDSNIGAGNIYSTSNNNTNYSEYKGVKLVGGIRFGSKDFDEKAWFESLNDFEDWDCIKFKDPISIFRPLHVNLDLRKQIFLAVGKKVLYSGTEDCVYHITDTAGVHERKIPEHISKLVQNKDADCSIFATVIDTEDMKNDVFNCQILWPPNKAPKLMIHCIQRKFRERQCKLKIGWMIVGYNTDLNFSPSDFDVQLEVQKDYFYALNKSMDNRNYLKFEYDPSALCFGIPVLSKLNSSNNSLAIGHHFFDDQKNRKIGTYTYSYCLKNNHYANLPDFTFCTLIISKYSDSEDYGTLPFKHINKLCDPLNPEPKYISLYSTEDNCGPIFLKQKHNEIKIKYCNNSSCRQALCICKSRPIENDLKCVFFDPNQGIPAY